MGATRTMLTWMPYPAALAAFGRVASSWMGWEIVLEPDFEQFNTWTLAVCDPITGEWFYALEDVSATTIAEIITIARAEIERLSHDG